MALVLCLCLPLFSGARAAGAAPAVSDNRGDQNYSTWAQPVRSYLMRGEGGGVTRVECIGESIVVEDYDRRFTLQQSRTLPLELEKFGGFYAGQTANYLIFGQDNPAESDQVEVIRVVQYSKDWVRQGQASLYGANTTVPFRAGSLRCDEYNGYLYIRTSHEMYTSANDGLNHQANLTFCVRQRDMEITDAFYTVLNSAYGYVSHSFNQFILVDEEGRLVALDHGDAYPRSAVLLRYDRAAGSDTFTGRTSQVTVRAFAGAVGQNQTGAALGGLAETASGYVTAFCDNGTGSGSAGRTVYLSYTPKDAFTTARTSTAALTSPAASTPVLVSMGMTGGYVLWNNMESGYTVGDTLYYAAYSAEGTVTAVRTAAAPLSDCQPLVMDGRVIWYVTDQSAPTFYVLDESGVTSYPAGQSGQESGAFTDVADSAWYALYVNRAAQAGLVQGVGNGRYDPERALTLAEVVTLAARFYAQEAGESVPTSAAGQPWYQGAYDYCVSRGLFTRAEYPLVQMNSSANRFQMVDILDRAVDVETMPVLNQVPDGFIPDLREDEPYGDIVYRWYRAGLAQGDTSHRFNGPDPITRAETATFLCYLAGLVPRVIL